ncbi:hypothetical protein C8R34_1447 [Nitrosomonas sp. Nm84]|uniref:hypothetical protein n=1 Tax=Nitrosomonas sp. Nm84 TaxID=200124 RepID=UPI000D75C62C|nr:hypothetical protein [Nitrosomonas sp. Nm84]PXW80874.1 hypothetical protein C8R34_1447 [Nitrosomonas sp. Nm84]
MRTTIVIDGRLWVYAKQQAAQQGCTLKQVIENALREFLSPNIYNRFSLCAPRGYAEAFGISSVAGQLLIMLSLTDIQS